MESLLIEPPVDDLLFAASNQLLALSRLVTNIRTPTIPGDIVGCGKVIAFFRHLVAAHPMAKQIDVVQDNGSLHVHPDVLAAVVEPPQIELVWSPTYAP